MQLWKKNFFFTFAIFQTLIFSGLFFMLINGFNQTLRNETATFKQLIASSEFLVDNLTSKMPSHTASTIVDMSNQELAFYLDISLKKESLFSSIPSSLKLTRTIPNNQLIITKEMGQPALYFQHIVQTTNGPANVFYVKNLAPIYKQQLKKNSVTYLIGLLFTFGITLLLYWQMKKIYRPIQNVAHELRTPLTLITGYSEMMMRVKTTEEQKVTMSSQIVKEAAHLQEVIEQLLLMGDLQDGKVSKEKLIISELIKTYQSTYNDLTIVVEEEVKIKGNKILLLRLFDNLLENAARTENRISVKLTKKGVIITNSGPTIPKNTLKKLNKGRQLLPYEYSGTGQGLIICRDIMQLHEGKLKISSDNHQTTVQLDFN